MMQQIIRTWSALGVILLTGAACGGEAPSSLEDEGAELVDSRDEVRAGQQLPRCSQAAGIRNWRNGGVMCPNGAEPADLDGDGCPLECPDLPVTACPQIEVLCQNGAEPADLDGDGCPLECPDLPVTACPQIEVLCQNGAEPADLDGDGCPLECPDLPVTACPQIEVFCRNGAEPADLDGDGCPLECPGS